MIRKCCNLMFLALMVLNINACKDKVEVAKITTDFGEIYIYLFDHTPKHQENFKKLAKEGFYDGTTFHRIIPNFMVQGGDPNSKDDNPNNDGQGGPGYTIQPEFNKELNHEYGSVAAARMGDHVNPDRESSGSQFYIVNNKKGTPHLDGQYTVFGKVYEGMDVVETISKVERDQRDRPLADVVMKKVEIVKVSLEKIKSGGNFAPPKQGS